MALWMNLRNFLMGLHYFVFWLWCLRRGTPRNLQRLSYRVYEFTQTSGEEVLHMHIQKI